ncbi:hypothetical protein V6N11_001862 [Hibiscus sabdariffa]|uniref:Uncharacterized protein n=1 Tax=Hibiscus sabdariffa TaxID=183260 RepID=A0ABR2QTH7_9ROSI
MIISMVEVVVSSTKQQSRSPELKPRCEREMGFTNLLAALQDCSSGQGLDGQMKTHTPEKDSLVTLTANRVRKASNNCNSLTNLFSMHESAYGYPNLSRAGTFTATWTDMR